MYNRAERHYPAHGPTPPLGNLAEIQFVTVCAAKHKAIFARPEAHQCVLDSWAAAQTWLVGRYVSMPDHIHLFCSPASTAGPSLEKWLQYWRALTSKTWPHPDEQPIWAKTHWDTQMRNSSQYETKWHYVRQNPVRGGLVGGSDDWPYSGELTELSITFGF